jgi:hypothetical protein
MAGDPARGSRLSDGSRSRSRLGLVVVVIVVVIWLLQAFGVLGSFRDLRIR